MDADGNCASALKMERSLADKRILKLVKFFLLSLFPTFFINQMFPNTVIRWSPWAISVIFSRIIDGKTSVLSFVQADEEIFPVIILDCIMDEPIVALDFSWLGHVVMCLVICCRTIHSSQ